MLRLALGFCFLWLAGCESFSAPAPLPQPLPASVCPNNFQSPIKNFCEVSPNSLWRGERPNKSSNAEWLIEHGVKSVVNLELLHGDTGAFEKAKPNSSAKIEIEYFNVREWEPNVVILPELLKSDVEKFLAIVKQAPKPIYVHCRSGQNRTGVMVAAYRIFIENMPVEEAIKEMGSYQGIWFAEDATFIRDLAKQKASVLNRVDELVQAHEPTLAAQFVCQNTQCEAK